MNNTNSSRMFNLKLVAVLDVPEGIMDHDATVLELEKDSLTAVVTQEHLEGTRVQFEECAEALKEAAGPGWEFKLIERELTWAEKFAIQREQAIREVNLQANKQVMHTIN